MIQDTRGQADTPLRGTHYIRRRDEGGMGEKYVWNVAFAHEIPSVVLLKSNMREDKGMLSPKISEVQILNPSVY